MSETPDSGREPTPSPPRTPDAPRSATAPLIAGAVLLVGAGVMSVGMLSGGGAKAPGGPGGHGGRGGPGMGPVPVRVAEVQGGELLKERRVPGELAAEDRAALRSRVSGQVVRIHRELGDTVEAGELLVTLDASTLPAELRRAEAQARAAAARAERAKLVEAQARRDLERRQALRKEGAVSAAELEQVKTSADAAEADARLAEAEMQRAAAEEEALRVRLAETRVRAPFAGRVAAVHVDAGTTVSPGELLVELVSTGPLLVRFSVPEGDAGAMRVGQRVKLRTAGLEHDAEVLRVGAALDPVSRALPVEGRLIVAERAAAAVTTAKEGAPEERPAEERRLLPGMFVEVVVATEAPPEAAVIPLEALIGQGARRTAFVVGEGKARAVEVHVLLDDGERAAVAGLDRGVRVVVAGADLLKDGQAVEAVQ